MGRAADHRSAAATAFSVFCDRAIPSVATAHVDQATPTPPHEVAALIFDTGDTLYDTTAWWRWVVQQLSHMGIHTRFSSIDRLWRRDYVWRINQGHADYWDTFRLLLDTLGMTRGQIDETVVAAKPMQRRFEEHARPLPGVQRTLLQLSKMPLPIGALSHVSMASDDVRRMLRQMRLDSFFDVIRSTYDMDCVATDRNPFDVMARALGVDSEHTMFVSHGAQELAKASGAGMTTVAFNYDQDARANVFVERIDQLVSLVRPMNPGRCAG